jgi:hypothetical protein
MLKAEFGLFGKDTTVKMYVPKATPKEEITVKFGPDKHPQSTEIKKKTKETKLKKTMQSWKEEQEKEQQIGVKIGWGGG